MDIFHSFLPFKDYELIKKIIKVGCSSNSHPEPLSYFILQSFQCMSVPVSLSKFF